MALEQARYIKENINSLSPDEIKDCFNKLDLEIITENIDELKSELIDICDINIDFEEDYEYVKSELYKLKNNV